MWSTLNGLKTGWQLNIHLQKPLLNRFVLVTQDQLLS